jgi:hypothetical protein
MIHVTGKAILALVANLIDKDFKLHDLIIFAKPFSHVAHSAAKIEKAIKKGLSTFGIGKYDTFVTHILNTVSLQVSLLILNIYYLGHSSVCFIV